MVLVRMLNGDAIEYAEFKGKAKNLKILMGKHLDSFYFELILLDQNQKLIPDHFTIKSDVVSVIKRGHHAYNPKLLYDAWELTRDERDLHRAVEICMNEKFYLPFFKLACLRGESEVVKSLLRANARCDPDGNEKDTPLEAACVGGSPEIVQLLLDIDIVTHYPPVVYPPEGLAQELAVAAEKRRINQEKNKVRKPSYPTLSGQNSDLVSPATTFYMSYRDSRSGLLALMRACRYRHLPIVRMLLHHGIRSDDQWAWSPIQIVAQENDGAITKCLIDYNADPNFTGQFHYDCPLYTAVVVCTTGGPCHHASQDLRIRDSRKLVDVLLKAKADPNLRSEPDRMTPLEVAGIPGPEEEGDHALGKELGRLRKCLIDAMMNAINKSTHNTPVHKAAIKTKTTGGSSDKTKPKPNKGLCPKEGKSTKTKLARVNAGSKKSGEKKVMKAMKTMKTTTTTTTTTATTTTTTGICAVGLESERQQQVHDGNICSPLGIGTTTTGT